MNIYIKIPEEVQKKIDFESEKHLNKLLHTGKKLTAGDAVANLTETLLSEIKKAKSNAFFMEQGHAVQLQEKDAKIEELTDIIQRRAI